MGYIDATELRNMISNEIGNEHSAELLEEILSDLDTNGDGEDTVCMCVSYMCELIDTHVGKIDFVEFLTYWNALIRSEVSPKERLQRVAGKVLRGIQTMAAMKGGISSSGSTGLAKGVGLAALLKKRKKQES